MIEILEKIKQYNCIIIHGHQRPDGDCIGSQLGLKRIIMENFKDKEVYAVGESSNYVSFLGDLDAIDDSKYQNALVIVVDVANTERISDKRFVKGKEIIKIDHHEIVESYGNINYVLPDYPACAEIITEFALENKLIISKDAAIALYTGIVTDTGRFRFDGVKGHTLKNAAYLLDLGVDVEYIDSKLSVETLETIKLKGYVLQNFKTTEYGFAYLKMTRDVINEFNVSDEDAAAQVSNLGGIEGYPIWALFVEYPNEIRIRLRSRGPRIDLLANKYGGGGHQKAAGGKLNTWRELDNFIEDVNELLINNK